MSSNSATVPFSTPDDYMFATLVAHSPDVMFRLDRDLRFVYVNAAVTQWTGITPDAFHGKTGAQAGMREAVWLPLAEQCRDACISGRVKHTEFSDNTPQGLRRFAARLIPEFDDARKVQTLLGVITDITDQWRMQSALRDSEIHFRMLADHTPGIIWISSAAGVAEYVNRRFYEATGLPAGASLQDNWAAAMHPDDLARMQANWAECIRSAAPCSSQFRQRFHDGGYRWQQGHAQPIRDAQGRVIRWISTVVDIDDAKRDAEALHLIEERLAHALTATGLGVWDWNVETNAVYYSASWAAMLGRAPDEIEPYFSAWERLLHPDDKARAGAVVEGVLRGEMEFVTEFRLLHKAGHYVSVRSRGHPLRRETGGPVVRIVGTHFDLTNRKRADAALRDSQEKLALAMEGAGFGLYDHDLLTGESHLDKRAKALLGIDDERPLNRENISAYVHPLDREARAGATARALDPNGDGRVTQEYRAAPRPGEAVRWIAGNGRVLFERGRAVRIIGLLRDITELKLLQERALQEKDDLLSLAETAGNAGSFELNVPADTMRLSPRLMQMYGLTTFDGQRESRLRLIHPDDVEAFKRRVDAVFERRETSNVHQFRLVRTDGRVIWLESNIKVFYDDHGRPLRVVGQNADITAHKQAEQRLREANETLRRMSMNQTKLLEEERARIARNLHDGVGQLLYLAGLRLSTTLNIATGKLLRGTLEEVFGVIGQATRDIRSIEFELSPPQLRQFGLLPALAWLAEEMQRQYGLRVTLDDDVLDKPLDPFISALLYRAVRELLINVVKHAQVGSALVQVRHAGAAIEVTVNDHGIGLAGRDAAASGGGLGLRGLHEALISGGCEISITSPQEGGTVAMLRAPLLPAAAADVAADRQP